MQLVDELVLPTAHEDSAEKAHRRTNFRARPGAREDLESLDGLDGLEAFGFSEGGRGLFLVSHLAPALDAASRNGGGAVVSATLPVKKPSARSYDPQRHVVDALPAHQEALPEGGFGKESFLRALVVQLVRAIEYQQGLGAAEAAVAQVGIDVGGRMKEEYRLARVNWEFDAQGYMHRREASINDVPIEASHDASSDRARVRACNRHSPAVARPALAVPSPTQQLPLEGLAEAGPARWIRL